MSEEHIKLINASTAYRALINSGEKVSYPTFRKWLEEQTELFNQPTGRFGQIIIEEEKFLKIMSNFRKGKPGRPKSKKVSNK
jgi:predicted methyltransferase